MVDLSSMSIQALLNISLVSRGEALLKVLALGRQVYIRFVEVAFISISNDFGFHDEETWEPEVDIVDVVHGYRVPTKSDLIGYEWNYDANLNGPKHVISIVGYVIVHIVCSHVIIEDENAS